VRRKPSGGVPVPLPPPLGAKGESRVPPSALPRGTVTGESHPTRSPRMSLLLRCAIAARTPRCGAQDGTVTWSARVRARRRQGAAQPGGAGSRAARGGVFSIPGLLVSDVSSPKQNALEFCRAKKRTLFV
jgi:hypothetical protein